MSAVDFRANFLAETASNSSACFESLTDLSGLQGKDISRTEAKFDRNTCANHSDRQLRASMPDGCAEASSAPIPRRGVGVFEELAMGNLGNAWRIHVFIIFVGNLGAHAVSWNIMEIHDW